MRTRKAAGFSLIEVLVAVLIVSIGVLGVAGLQFVALRNNTNALFRTQAFQLAYDVIDRARANPDQDYALAFGDAAPDGPDCTATDCTPTEVRDYDLEVWMTDLSDALPSGDAQVEVNGDIVTVTVQWRDERAPEDPDCPGADMVCLEVSTAL